MTDDILIWKKKKDSTIKVKVAKQVKNRYSEPLYNSTVNVRDPKQLAQMLEDLKIMFDAPIDKAIKEMKKQRSPFW